MNVLRAIRVAELRKKVAVIPAKIILTILIVGLYLFFTSEVKTLEAVWAAVQSEPKVMIAYFFVTYGVISFVSLLIQMFNSRFIGVIISVVIAVILFFARKYIPESTRDVILIIVVMAGPVIDMFNCVRYYSLKKKVIEAEEENLHDYDDGFEEGYRRGMEAGARGERIHRVRREPHISINREDYRESYIEDSFEDSGEDAYEDYIEEDYSFGSNDSDSEKQEEPIKYIYGNSENVAGFFVDCKDEKAIKKRYHDLCKVYHPDSGNVSSNIFYRIKDEYDSLMKQAKS